MGDLWTILRIREYLISQDRDAKLCREFWNCNGATYSTYRNYLSRVQEVGFPGHQAPSSGGSKQSGVQPTLTSKYAFAGVQHIIDVSLVAISAIKFAHVRADMLAFANKEGAIWRADFPSGAGAPILTQAEKIHQLSVTCLDWSLNNAHLLSCAEDGSVCIWEAESMECIRSMTLTSPATCCKFHPLNSNLALVGTGSGHLEVLNCSAGTPLQKVLVTTGGLTPVTTLDVSNQHVFVGDGKGAITMFKTEMQHGQPAKVTRTFKVSGPKARAGAGSPGIVLLQHLPWCSATATPVVVVVGADTSFSILRVDRDKAHHRLQPFLRSSVSLPLSPLISASAPPRRVVATLCPLSSLSDIPLITLGSDDTNVSIYHLAPEQSRPLVVACLQGHGAAVSGVSWSFDETLLASADTHGVVIVWKHG